MSKSELDGASTPGGPAGPAQRAPARGDAGRLGAEEAGSGLAPDIREHLGVQLRTEYDVISEKPAFLGDPAIPPQFEEQIVRLETRERVHTKAVEAVAHALQDVVLEETVEREVRHAATPEGSAP